jgi:NADH-quinone oxidoreductase subunit H
MLLAAMGVVMSVGSMRLTDIAQAQASGPWFVIRQPIGFVIFSIAVLAEINRTPFDMSEADSELVAGYHTEYSGMKFGLVQLAEYTALLMGSYLIATLFLGGWNMPLLPASPVWLFLKTVLLMGSTMWFRSTFPRMKVDTLMEMSWKVLIPVALANIMLIASLMLVLPKRWF